MFLMQYFTGSTDLKPDKAQKFAPNENSGIFYQPLLGKPGTHTTDEEFAAVRPFAQKAIAASSESHLFVKTHHWFGKHHGTPTVNKRATAHSVYLVRNPLDVVVSYAAFRQVDYDKAIEWLLEKDRVLPRIPGGSYFIAGSWSQNVHSWRTQSKIPHKILKYEDLVAAPETEFSELLKEWQVNVDGARLKAAVAATSLSALKKAETKHGFREKPAKIDTFFRSGRAGEGAERLSIAQKQRVITACGDEMTALGYSTTAR